ncbi:MAG TPA: hypothetical protein VGQ57_01160, partial [Polyangiaceae bacterium]|nr:hypothetical protein [Polyangiaceae bacterium]
MAKAWWKVAACGLLFGCASSDKDGATKPTSVTVTGATACERYASLAMGLGCTPPKDCMITVPQCDDEA